MKFRRFRSWRNAYFITITSLICILLPAGSFIFIKEKRVVTLEKVHEIESVSNLKSKQVTEWYKDEVNDALVISQNTILQTIIKNCLINKTFNNEELNLTVKQLASQHDYTAIILADAQGNILYSSDKDTITNDTPGYTIKQFAITYNPFVTSSGIYKVSDNSLALDFVTNPHINGISVKLIFRLDPNIYLFPLMSYSPVYEGNLRSALIEYYGNNLNVISAGGKIDNFKAVHKYETGNLYTLIKRINDRVFKARDANGKLIIGYLSPIKGTPWSLYSKADTRELFMSFNRQAIFMIFLSLMVSLMMITAISLLYSQQQKEVYKSLYQMFVDSPQPMWIYDLETLKFLEVNQAAILHYGYSREEFLSMTIKEIRPPEDVPLLLENVATTTHPYNDAGIWRHIKKDGETIYVNIKSHKVLFNKRNARHVLANDITDIKKAQDALADSEQKFRHLFENHSAVKIIIDPEDGRIADANEAAAKFYGYTREQLTNMYIFDINTLDKEALDNEVNQVVEKKKILFEFVHRKSDGTLTDVEVFSSRIRISGKYFLHSIVHDITEKKKAKEQVEKMVQELIAAKTKAEESDHLKTAFLANMSHEIRTPMNGILGFMELLKQPGLSGDQVDEYINIVKTSGERLLSTINDIVDIARIESGQIFLSESGVDLNNLLTEQYKFFKHEAANKGLKLSISSLLNDEDKLIMADSAKLQSIIINLIKNAIKFTKSGSISFGVIKSDKWLIFNVTDTGKGIPAERKSKIFERFIQADVSISRDYEGSGLGLSISKAYVELMGGNIEVESEVGKGSVFIFKIPYKSTDYIKKPEVHTSKAEDPCHLPEGLNIVIAEDDEISYIYLSRMLKKYKVNLIRVYNGQEAVQECLSNPDISLVLMDIKMPIMDGCEATRIILSQKPDLPIVALTAFALSDDKENALNCGCVDYLSKPVNKETLLKAISKYSIKKATA